MEYNDDIFRQRLKAFLNQGLTECSRGEARQEKRFNLQYDQEEHSADRLDLLRQVFGQLKGKKILEVGAGSGGLTVALGLSGAEAYGIEPDPLGLETCELRQAKYDNLPVHFSLSTAEKLPYPDNFFDGVFMFSVLEHVKDIRKAIQEMYRVLRPEGVCFIDAPNYLWPVEQHYRIIYPPLIPKILGKFYLKMRGKNSNELDHLNYLTPNLVKRELNWAGFKQIENLSDKELADKIHTPAKMSYSKTIKRILETVQTAPVLAKIAQAALLALVAVGFYPVFKIRGIK